MARNTRTTVAIVGGGPAGLMLSHLLPLAGIESVVIDVRTRAEIEETHRAGILEQDSVRMLVDTGVSDRVLRDGYRHEGIELAFGGGGHRIDFQDLVDASVQLYPQTDVFIDLANARERDHGDVRFGVSEVSVVDVTSDSPAMQFIDEDGRANEVRCDYLVGCRRLPQHLSAGLPGLPAPAVLPGVPVRLVRHPLRGAAQCSRAHLQPLRPGFALISQRTDTLQRMYFQCDVDTDVADWSDDRIWEELQARLGANGYTLKEGPITSKMVLPFRSFVQEPMRYGNLLLAGDAAHTVPPTGAKGLNLALADVRVLAEELERAIDKSDGALLDDYTTRALDRVWRAQHFSYWMTTMLHLLPESSPFDVRRQIGELSSLTSSRAGSTYLAEAYTGWPSG